MPKQNKNTPESEETRAEGIATLEETIEKLKLSSAEPEGVDTEQPEGSIGTARILVEPAEVSAKPEESGKVADYHPAPKYKPHKSRALKTPEDLAKDIARLYEHWHEEHDGIRKMLKILRPKIAKTDVLKSLTDIELDGLLLEQGVHWMDRPAIRAIYDEAVSYK